MIKADVEFLLYLLAASQRDKELFPWRLASLRQGGPAGLPTQTGPDGRQGDHQEYRGGGADQAGPPHLRGGPQADRGVRPQAPAAHLAVDHAAGPR